MHSPARPVYRVGVETAARHPRHGGHRRHTRFLVLEIDHKTPSNYTRCTLASWVILTLLIEYSLLRRLYGYCSNNLEAAFFYHLEKLVFAQCTLHGYLPIRTAHTA